MILMHCRLQIRRSYQKASLTKQLVSRVNRFITLTQEWLEGEDKPSSKAVGYGVVAVAFLYLIGQVVRAFE